MRSDHIYHYLTAKGIRPRVRNWVREAAIIISLLVCFTQGWSQINPADTSFETRKSLSKELRKKRAERAVLKRILASLNIVDSAYIVHYPTWIINDEDIRERVRKVFRNRLKFPSRDSELVVITNPSRTEIEILAIGSVSMGREEVRLFIGDILKQTILTQDYAREDVLEPSEPRKPITAIPAPKTVFFEGSLFGGSIKFSSGWGIEMKMGNDAIGYPFWSTGSADMSLVIDQIKIGAVVPMNVGFSESPIVGPLTIQPRKLNGAGGFTASYGSHLFNGMIDLNVVSCILSSKDTNEHFTSLTDAYYVRNVVQGIYTQRLGIINNEHMFTIGIGFGYHQIGKADILSNSNINTTDKFNSYSPIFRINYRRQGLHTYGIEVQSYASTLLISSWIELVKDFVYADLKYSIPVFRGPDPWENSYFIMLSPRIRLSF